MSESRARRLNPLINIAEQAVQEALVYLGKIQRELAEEIERKDALSLYEKEYQLSFAHKGKGGISGADIQQFESFLLQIHSALKQQAGQISRIESKLEKAQNVYIRLKQRLESYKKLKTRLTEQAIASENRQLQKLLDEIGMQLYRSHSETR